MPHQARIDAPGALQHIIVRGIERRAIFKNDTDRDEFIDCALMGKKDILWQNTADVSALFGKTVTDARKSYADYVSKEYEQSIA